MSKEYCINSEIKSPYVNLVMEDGVMRTGVSIREALNIAFNAELDLVEVSKNGNIPVCKILSYEKMLYKEKKAQKQQSKHHTETKEIRFSYNIGENDLNIKNKKVLEFLNKKHNVKYVLQLRGREKSMVEQAKLKMDNCLLEFKDIAVWNKIDISGRDNSVVISVLLVPA